MVFEGSIVVERSKSCEVFTDARLADPPVEIHDVGMILLHDLGGAGKPVIGPSVGDKGKVIGKRCAVPIFDPGVRWTIECCIGWVVDVGRECTSLSVEEVVLDTVR